MARFILLWVRDNNKVEPLIERLKMSAAVKVVGLFADPTEFCDLSCGRVPNGELRTNPVIVHPIWGTPHCGRCKKVVNKFGFNLRNGMDDKHMTAPLSTLRLIFSPPRDGSLYDGRSPREIYGDDIIDDHIASKRKVASMITEMKSTASVRAARRRARRTRSTT